MGAHRITVNSYAPGAIDTAMCESRHKSLILTIYFTVVKVKTMDAAFAKNRPGAKEGDYYKLASAMICRLLSLLIWNFVNPKQADELSPLGHKGSPEDIASVVSYIASQEAHFITGQSVSFRRGIHWLFRADRLQ